MNSQTYKLMNSHRFIMSNLRVIFVVYAAGKFYGLSNSTLRNERIIRKYENAECFHIAVLLPG